MRAEGLSIALRARTPWEATDLGIALVREYAAPIWRAWACVVLPTALLLGLMCHMLGNVSVASLLLWWLKPVFDRIPLSQLLQGKLEVKMVQMSAKAPAKLVG